MIKEDTIFRKTSERERSNATFRFLGRGFVLWSFAFLLSACAKSKTAPKTGFYYWKTQFELTAPERNVLDSLNAQLLYVRIFDVDWDFNRGEAIPKGTQSNIPDFPPGVDVVPAIYVTNRTFLQTKQVDSLAQKISDYSRRIIKDWTVRPSKLQLDVDWTAGTKDKYFEFIRNMKAMGVFDKISVTIRLHQYKYPKQTGIPPADEGVLMCYNTGKITDWHTQNSIATPKEVNKYLQNTKTYPLELGIALPIFSWTVIFRDSSFYKIVSDGDLSWQKDSVHYRQLSPTRYVVTSNTFLKGHYLYEGDLLRYEMVREEDLLTIAQFLRQSSGKGYKDVLFYHLAEENLKRLGANKLQAVVDELGHE
ncbi:MAG TPA: hypothetical protein ENK85_02185 [Saprospiraceae bacterium]|nr:hypothetical protein [Saprospiraceae bacterium]